MVHVKSEIREAANEAKIRIKAWFDARFVHRALYDVLKQTSLSIRCDEYQKRLIQKTLALFERNGVALHDKEAKRLVVLRGNIAAGEAQFQKNLGEDRTFVLCNPAFIDI